MTMKKIFTILALIVLSASMFAQVPQKFSYQAVVRDNADQLVVNQAVGMQVSILKDSATGAIIYSEVQTPITNANGLISIEIGGEAGFDTINWADGIFYIKTESDPSGGTNYTISGTSQLLSVPFALYAQNGESTKSYSVSNSVNFIIADPLTTSGTATLILQLSDIPAGTYAVNFSSPIRNTSTSYAGINLVWAITTNNQGPTFPIWGIASAFIPSTGWSANYPFGQSGFKVIELSSTGTIEVMVAYYGSVITGAVSVDGLCSLTALKI